MSDQHKLVLTIGHSTHANEDFLSLLRRHEVTALADVRSVPISRFTPQFNKGALAQSLKENGIRYVFLGGELGARSDDRSCYENGRVQYERLARTELFLEGIQRVIDGAQRHRVALMCAEKEPLECHRTLLVARAFDRKGIRIAHILGDGQLEDHRAAMERLLDLTRLPHEDLFRSRDELIDQAIARQEAQVAYVDEALLAD